MTNFVVGLTSYKGVLGGNFNYGDFANGTPAFANGGDDFWGGNGVFTLDRWKSPLNLVDLTDGASNTLLVGVELWAPGYANSTVPGSGSAWAHPVEASATCATPPNYLKHASGTPIDLASADQSEWGGFHGFKSKHPGGVRFAYADGSVHFVRDTTPRST